MSVRRSLLVLALLTLLLPLAVFSMRANQMQRQDARRTLQFYTVGRGDIEVTVTAIGALEAESSVSLSFGSPGRVVEVLAQPGDYVLAGDVLARLDDLPQRVAYDQAVLALRLAELQKAALLEPASEQDIRVAEANISSAQGAYNAIASAASAEDIRAAELRYQQALAAQQDLIDTRSRAPGGAEGPIYQALTAQLGAATFNTEIARLQLESARSGGNRAAQLSAAGARIVQAQRELERLKAGPTQAELDRADIAIRQAQVGLQRAELALQDTVLKAAFDGLIAAVNLEVGALVTPGTPAVELLDVSPLRLSVQVDEIDIRQVREGQPASVRLDALPGIEFPATVEQIALVGQNADGIISYDVVIRIDIPDARVRVGMTAEAAIIVEQRRNTLVVPNLYVRLDRETQRAYVNMQQPDGSLQEVEVRLGLIGQDESEVLSGLKAGDVVVIDVAGTRFNLFGG